jgi:hypothetical protein
MKAVEFESQLGNNGRIELPSEVAQLPAGSSVRVIVLWDLDKDDDWQRLSIEGFANAYAEQDSVYEKLIEIRPVP